MRKTTLAVLVATLGLALALGGCTQGTDTSTTEGTVTLSLTDSPVLASNVSKAVITLTGIEYSLADATSGDVTWETLVTFDTPQELDLLTLQGGAIAELANESLPAGHIGQIRFILDAPEATTGGGAPSTSGCYIELTDGTQVPLFVPSGSSSGFKATGSFDVPSNGSVEITADFDVRKSVVQRGASGSYLLKPTIRLVVNNEAGGLNVTVAGATAYAKTVVFAYADGTYSDAESVVTSGDSATPQFSGAVSSATAGTDGGYALRFLAAGTYDLVVAAYDATGTFVAVAGIYPNATVTSGTNTPVAVDLATLAQANVVLSLTDAPLVASNVARAVIAIDAIEYSLSTDAGAADATWQTLVSYDSPQEFDLLTLQSGTVALLAAAYLPAGHIGQIRFILDAAEATTGGGAPTTSGCFVELADGTQVPLFVPSGSSSGFKATGAFDVPVNGSVAITADFDVRKSVVQRGASGSYLLKPTIRLVVNDQAGTIVVSVANAPAAETLVVYAYANGTYVDSEATAPVAESDPPQFSSAVSSAVICDDGAYRLPYLAAGTYDLVVAGYTSDGTFVGVKAVSQDAIVTSDHTTQVSITL